MSEASRSGCAGQQGCVYCPRLPEETGSNCECLRGRVSSLLSRKLAVWPRSCRLSRAGSPCVWEQLSAVLKRQRAAVGAVTSRLRPANDDD